MQQPTVQIATAEFVIDAHYSMASYYIPRLVNALNERFHKAGLQVYCVVESDEDHCIKVVIKIIGAVVVAGAAVVAWTISEIREYPETKAGIIAVCEDVKKLDHRIPGVEQVRVFCHRVSFTPYGPVTEGQTLTEIVGKFGSKSYTEAQFMWAIVKENPDAFVGGNVDRLKAGATLRIPSSVEILKTTHDQASHEIAKRRTKP